MVGRAFYHRARTLKKKKKKKDCHDINSKKARLLCVKCFQGDYKFPRVAANHAMLSCAVKGPFIELFCWQFIYLFFLKFDLDVFWHLPENDRRSHRPSGRGRDRRWGRSSPVLRSGFQCAWTQLRKKRQKNTKSNQNQIRTEQSPQGICAQVLNWDAREIKPGCSLALTKSQSKRNF